MKMTLSAAAGEPAEEVFSVTVPGQLAGRKVTGIGKDVFENRRDMTGVVLPASLEYIGEETFRDCGQLASIVLPAHLETIGAKAFENCKSLQQIIFRGEAPDIGGDAFRGVCAKVYYPAGSSSWIHHPRRGYGGELTWVPYPAIQAENDPVTGKICLKWTKTEYAVCYALYRSSQEDGTYSLLAECREDSYVDSDTEPGLKYHYYIVAVDAQGNASPRSRTVGHTCDLAAPEVSVGNRPATGKIQLSWSAVQGAEKYAVYCRAEHEDEYVRLVTTRHTVFLHADTCPGLIYSYRVKALHDNSAANSDFSETVRRRCCLPRPVVSLGNDAATGKPRISWEPVEEAEEYRVYCSDRKCGMYSLLKVTSDTSVVDNSVKTGEISYYRVKAVHSIPGAGSDYSAAKYRTCDLAKPVAQVSLNKAGKPVLTWKPVKGAVEYAVYLAKNNKRNFEQIRTVKTPSFLHKEAVSGKTYFYKVMALAPELTADSASSNVVSIRSK